jgi:hypothetical protein
MVHAGYWAGYYSSTKKPKPLNAVLEQMSREFTKKQNTHTQSSATEKPDVDVDLFLQREQRRLAVLGGGE